MGTGKLREPEKRFIVMRLAQYDSPAEAVKALNEEFRVEISPQAAERYDPGKRAGRRIAKHLRALFEETRQQFHKDIDAFIPNANKAVRVRKLSRAADSYEDVNNFMAMASMLEKVAKELGNSYTNRYEHTGKGGGAIKVEDVTDMTPDMIQARIDTLWAKAQGRTLDTEVTATTKPH